MASGKRTLEQILLEYAGKPNAGNAAKNYAAFMEHWGEICKAHDTGWSYLTIWKAMREEGVFTFSYPAFTNYIRKLKRRRSDAEASRSQNHNPSPESSIPPQRRERRF